LSRFFSGIWNTKLILKTKHKMENEINNTAENATKNMASNLVLAEGQNCCPKCQSDWDGGSILETFIKQREEGVKMWQGKSDEEIEAYMKESYSPPYRWGRKTGIEIQGGYDGVSYWQCPDCKATFNRFTGAETILPLR
jgi:hypothetical protein